MTRGAAAQPACPACQGQLRVDEPASARTGRLVYACSGCGAHFSARGGPGLVAEQGVGDVGGSTVRMRRHAAGARPARDALDPLPEGMSLALEVTDGPARGSVFHLTRRMTVLGREEGEIRIPDSMISRRHASLEVHDMETIVLRDLSSTNGTYCNDQLIAFCRIKDGDEIRLGSTTLTVAVDVLG